MTDCASPSLFTPIALGKMRLRNRVAMAPMTRNCAPEGVPTQAMADYYGRRASGGVGMIITEGAAPCEAGWFGRNSPRLYGRDVARGWLTVTDAIHAGGAQAVAQIWHVGAFMPSLVGMADTIAPERLSPSGLAAPGQPLGRALGQEDIARTIQAFADAALLARDAGFDGVEIHAAHGYLPDQFFWAATNQRQDRYGGPLRDRARFGAEIVAACKARVGDDFHVQMRISQWKQSDYAARVAQTPEDLADWLRPLVQAGVDMFHVSTRRYWDAAFPGRAPTLAGWVRRVTGTPVMAVGSVTLDRDFKAPDGKLRAETVPTQIASIEDAISAGEFDMIAVGRALLANPDWPQIVASGALDRIKPFDRACLETLH